MNTSSASTIKMAGLIYIKTLNGRFGAFNVAKLQTSLGEFVIKDKLLEEFSEGKYEGEFWLRLIKPSFYTYSGRVVIENRAYLHDMQISNYENCSTDDLGLQTMQDPIIEEQPALVATLEDNKSHNNKTVLSVTTEPENDEQLFGHLYQLQTEMRLDPTTARDIFRQQTTRLKALGYRFNGTSKLWIRIEHI